MFFGNSARELIIFCFAYFMPGAQPGGFGAFVPPPKFSKHRIAILAFAETFKELK